MTALTYIPGDPALKIEPWSFYQRLRDEAPVLYGTGVVEGAENFYVVSRFDDAAMLLRDKNRFSSYLVNRPLLGQYLDLPALINRDAPEHTRLRRVTNRAFGPRALAPLPERIQQLVDELVGEILSKPEVEFVEEFSAELPMRVVGGMLGIPLDRKTEIRHWSAAFLEMGNIIGGGDPDLVPGCVEDFMALVDFMDEQFTGQVGCPHRGDIISDLVSREEAGELSHDEAVSLGWSYLSAGKETTQHLLGGGLQMLLTDPLLAERLTAEPERTDDFIEEHLRLYSPTQFILRRVKEDVELHGVVMPATSIVHVLVGSANRDPRKFPDPDVFDLDRPNSAEHLAFGAGSHFCPGAALARMVARLAFRALYPHLSRLSLDPERPPQMRIKPGAFGIEYMNILVSQDTTALANLRGHDYEDRPPNPGVHHAARPGPPRLEADHRGPHGG
jgi:cytochrome P450